MPYQGRELGSNWVWKVNWFSSSPKSSWAGDHFPGARPGADRNQPAGHHKQGDLICLDGKLGADGNALSASLICAKCVTSRRKIRVKHSCTVGTELRCAGR